MRGPERGFGGAEVDRVLVLEGGAKSAVKEEDWFGERIA